MKNARLCAVFVAVGALSTFAPAQITGSGTAGNVAVWTSKTKLGNSAIVQKTGNVGIGTKAPAGKLEVDTGTASGMAIVAHSNSTTGVTFGVFGTSSGNSDGATGVFGFAYGTTGLAFGMHGVSASTNGIGVQGESQSVGVAGINTLCNPNCAYYPGVAGEFTTGIGGSILTGYTSDSVGNWTRLFRVDDKGKGFFDGGTQTGGADFAESVAVSKGHNQYEPGDLLVVDATTDRQLTIASEPYSGLVAGIYSTKPGVLATTHKLGEAMTGEIPLAIVGIVPCKVTTENGPIRRGDLLVSSSTAGHAMKGTDRNRMLGAVIGKALEPLSDGRGVIQVLVTLQ